jgi:hypothetical protein
LLGSFTQRPEDSASFLSMPTTTTTA